MSLCTCIERPQCEFAACDSYADFSVRQPAWPQRRGEHFKFMCERHLELFISKTHIAGIDRPPGASDFWRPSLVEAFRHGDMEIRRQRDHEITPEIAPLALTAYQRQHDQRFTPTQLKNIERLRAGLRERMEEGK